jgi:hypothetical protein
MFANCSDGEMRGGQDFTSGTMATALSRTAIHLIWQPSVL